MDKLRTMAKDDSNYRELYKRLMKSKYDTNPEAQVSFANIKTPQASQLLNIFWNYFKKQNPSVQNVFILENGDVVTGEAALSTAALQFRDDYKNNIIARAKDSSTRDKFFIWDKKAKKFVGNPFTMRGVSLDTPEEMISFLSKLGIQFAPKELNYLRVNHKNIYQSFKEAVGGIRRSIIESEEIASFAGKTLSIEKRLLELGVAKSIATNPSFNSTYFNVVGERMQTYIGPNAASNLYDVLSNVKNINELKDGPYAYLIPAEFGGTDTFAQGSDIIRRMFDDNGNRRKTASILLQTGYAGGMMYDKMGKSKEPSRFTYMQRLINEMNMNLKGWYNSLVPGDANLEHITYMGNPISTDSIRTGMEDVHDIFGKYFVSEFNTARDETRKVDNDRKKVAHDLRFFKDILPDKLYRDVMRQNGDGEVVYNANIDGVPIKDEINKAIDKYIEKNADKFQRVLTQMGVLDHDEKGYTLKNVNLPARMGEKALKNELTALTVNYMIANTEMHKLLYGDPYQYMDELKRVKLFLSPRQSIMYGSEEMNKVLNKVWNKGVKQGDVAYTDFLRDYFRTATLADIRAFIDLPGYKPYKETDGAGIISYKAYRNFRIRLGNWNFDKEENQFKYDMAWEKSHKGITLTKEEQAILDKGNPMIQSAYTPLKPIVTGNKANNQSYNSIVVDKYALYPLSYRMMSDVNTNGGKDTSNALALYDKMQNEDIDYVVFNSGRKVGAEETHDPYNKGGSFNNSPYKGIVNVPFSAMSLQTEVPSKEGNQVTTGSQMNKLVTMDFLEAGVPIDFEGKNFEDRYTKWNTLSDEEKEKASPLFKEIKNNQNLKEALLDDGYSTLINKLGIEETTNKNGEKQYNIPDLSKALDTIKDEILKREINDNLIDALKSFGDQKSLLESTPAYQQVRHILYSIVDKLMLSPKISGGMKVQIPVSFLEGNKIEKIEGKNAYESNTLRFYSRTEDGKKVNVCQMMLGRWFDSDKSDKELLDYFNNTEEGKKILRGIAFRIPTQRQNSIDVFELAQFLPKEFGDSVVIPSALVDKAGSDFDIDKLTMYLKNVYQDIDGNIKLVPPSLTKQQVYDLYDKGEFLSPKQKGQLEDFINREREVGFRNVKGQPMVAAENILLRGLFPDQFTDEALTQAFMEEVASKGLREMLVGKLYRQSLENAYIESCENLVSHPLNYDQLIKPNSADQLHKLADEITIALHREPFDYEEVGNMLDRTYMSRLRHAFISGKQAIAISAVAQTNHSLNQRQPITIDNSLLERCTPEDKQWLGDGMIKFSRVNRVKIGTKMLPTLSKITNAVGQHISDLISQFIDGYVDISKGPWIMELGAYPNVTPTFLFLTKLGVPIDDIAYFMNQPIIRSYLNKLESQGYSWLFNDALVGETAADYADEKEMNDAIKERKSFIIPSLSSLKETIGKRQEQLNKQQIRDQLNMLDEFLKYAKMATHLLSVTQATNYDTANFNDPLLIWKKEMQMDKAQKTLIDDAQSLLNNSFIGHIPQVLRNTRNAIAKILTSDQTKVRRVLQKVLLPYVDMRDDEFLKIARKATADIFDYTVQTDGKFNQYIKELFDGGAVDKIASFVREAKKDKGNLLHDNFIVNTLQVVPSPKASENSVNNIKIKGTDNKVYDQNNIIYAFRELRDTLGKDSEIYKGLINVAILQSGLSPSNISYTSLIPFEDFAEVYGKTMSRLNNIDLDPFHELGVFYKNNWNNDDIVTRMNAFWYSPKNKSKIYNLGMAFFDHPQVREAVKEGKIPPVMNIPIGNREANQKYVFYTWNAMDDLLTDKDWDIVNKQEGTRAQRSKKYERIFDIQNEMRKRGDFSYMRKALFERVVDDDNNPFTIAHKGKSYVIYKAVNAWGDGNKANEFYDVEKPSVIDNGLEKVKPTEDNDIIDVFNQPQEKVAPREKYVSPEADWEANKNKTLANNIILPKEFEMRNEKSEINDVLKKKEEESKKCN